MAKLLVAVGVAGPLARLLVGLQAVAERAQQPRHRLVRDLVPCPAQRLGELAYALGRPAQRLLGVAPRVRIDETLEILHQARVGL